MSALILVILVVFVGCCCGESLYLPPATDVDFIIVGFRHGYRNPSMFIKNDTTREKFNWGWEGTSQLTNIGKQQAYSLGKFLRQRYEKVLPVDYVPAQVKSYSSSAERCQQTLFTVLAGAFPPKGHAVWNKDLAWQPPTVVVDDPLLRMYNVKCPTYTTVYQPISDDVIPQSTKWLKEKQDVAKYIAENAGFNASLSDLADAADNVQSMIYNKVDPMPDWIQKPTLKGFNKDKLIKEILSFAEAHQIQCAEDLKGCAKAMAGLWLNQINGLLKDKRDGKLKDRKAHFYGAHTETVLSLMKLMNMDVHETPTSAGLIIEYKASPPSIRTFFHEADSVVHDSRKVHLVNPGFCKGTEWCPLATFLKGVEDKTVSDWQEYCKLPKCEVTTSN